MNNKKKEWMILIIDRLLSLEIGNPEKLKSIKSELLQTNEISLDAQKYFFEKLENLKRLEEVQESPQIEKSRLSASKIIGLSILGLIVVGGAYLWFTEIGPEIQRVNQLQEDIQNQPSYIERVNEKYSSVEDCAGVSGASPPEIRERCLQVFRYSNP